MFLTERFSVNLNVTDVPYLAKPVMSFGKQICDFSTLDGMNVSRKQKQSAVCPKPKAQHLSPDTQSALLLM